MPYKIVFSDIDGTLLNKDRELSTGTITEIRKLKDEIPFILISARMPAAMRHLQKDLGIEELPVICYNGGLIIANGTIVSSTEIPIEIAEDLHNYNSEINCHISLYHKDEWYVPQMDQWALREINNTKVTPVEKSGDEVLSDWKDRGLGVHKIMAMGEEENIEKILSFLKSKYDDKLHLYRSKNTYIEIAPKQISKFSAIEFLLNNYFNLGVAEAVAFGDNYNDVEMLEKIGYGVAVENARNEAKAVANAIAGKSTGDGVAQILRELFKK
ncbi:fructose-phosphate phosphohydrolase SppA [soil metagenome]